MILALLALAAPAPAATVTTTAPIVKRCTPAVDRYLFPAVSQLRAIDMTCRTARGVARRIRERHYFHGDLPELVRFGYKFECVYVERLDEENPYMRATCTRVSRRSQRVTMTLGS